MGVFGTSGQLPAGTPFFLGSEPAGVVGHSVQNPGVISRSDDNNGVLAQSRDASGVFSASFSPTGSGVVAANLSGGNGVESFVGDGAAVVGSSRRTGTGVAGSNFGSNLGGTVQPATGVGVSGYNEDTGIGVKGESPNGTGVRCSSDKGLGVWGSSNNAAGVLGSSEGSSSNGVGVHGFSSNNVGVQGISSKTVGVRGSSISSSGVDGRSTSGTGVVGRSDNFVGVRATCTSKELGFGVIAEGRTAGLFAGSVAVFGDLTVTGNKPFKIDHPLDPQNKYLLHNAVEAPERKNVYDGVARLDKDGATWVELPEWFEALNGDFRYQLTAVGGAAPNLHVAEEVSENRFKIAGGQEGMRICWQLTGTRKDPWAAANPFEVEQEKPEEERGRYLEPSLYDAPEEQRVLVAPIAEAEEEEQRPPQPSGIDFARLEARLEEERRRQLDELRRLEEEHRREMEELRRRMEERQEDAPPEST